LRASRFDFLALLGIDQAPRTSPIACKYNYVHLWAIVKAFLRPACTRHDYNMNTTMRTQWLLRHNFFNGWDGIIFTPHRRNPSTKRTNSRRSAARKQLFPEAKTCTGSCAARSVQLSGSSHWRPFLSRKQTLCSPLYSLHARASNSWPESGWKGCVIRNFLVCTRRTGVV